jgi:class 3 adenylate cyclase/predicted ATPase
MSCCPSCNAQVEPSARFCSSCGTRLEATAPPSSSTAEAPAAEAAVPIASARKPPATQDRLRAERRQLTVMFCDIADSTKLSEQLDPEDLMSVVRRYQSVCAQVIERFGGSIAQYLGDGLLVYFGWPTAYEDAAARAGRAGIEILASLDALNEELQREHGVALKLRVGIHTGLVVVGEVGGGAKREQLAVGDTANIAARLESLAQPNTGVISDAMRRLIGGLFDLESLGTHELKGIATPMEVHRLLRLRARHRLEGAGEQSLAPFVGRQAELGVLHERWQGVEGGRGAAVLLRADPGVGKSRMIRAFEAALRERPHSLREAYCLPFFINSALHPWVELVRVESGIGRDDAPATMLGLLQAWIERQPAAPIDALPLLATLLDIPQAAGYEGPALSPLARKLRTIEVLVELLLPLPEGPPAVVVLEDLHWVDPSSLELLKLLVAKLSERPALLIMTARPAFESPWAGDASVEELPLRPFENEDTRALVLAMTQGLRLPAQMLAQLVERTDGIPLFVEELTRMLIDAGQLEDTRSSAIPATLHDSLMARLDRLDPLARRVAQLGASIGRAFHLPLLRRIFSGTEGELRRGIDELVDTQLVHRAGDDVLVFKHALIQDVAYESLLKRTRQEYHGRIAQALEQGFGPLAEVEPELLAHHLEGAGVTRLEDAVRAWLRAGERAQASSSNQEAVSHLRRGLELLPALPASPQRVELELRLLTKLGTSLSALKGYAADEVEQAWARADALCDQLGSTPERFWVLWGLWAFYLVQGTHPKGLHYAERMLELATERGAMELQLEAHFSLGLSYFFMGDDLPRAREHLEWVVERYDSELHHAQALLAGQDVGVTSRSVSALVCFQLGALELAVRRHREALELSARLGHAFSRAYALGCAAWFQLYMRDMEQAQGFADEAVALSQEQSFGWWLVWGTILGGSARAGQGESGAADLIEQWIGLWRQTGSGFTVPYFLGLLSNARRGEGKLDEAERLLGEARPLGEATSERFFEAELRRLQGELLLARSGDDEEVLAEAEAALRGAMEIARAQGARAWELRAACSLAKLLARRGRADEAKRVAEEVLAAYASEPSTPELVEARALVDGLR